MSLSKIFFFSFTLTMYSVYYFYIDNSINIKKVEEKNSLSIKNLKETKKIVTKVIEKICIPKDLEFSKKLESKKDEKTLIKKSIQSDEKLEIKEKKVLHPPKNDSDIKMKKLDKKPIDIKVTKNENQNYYNYNRVPNANVTLSIKKGQLIFKKKLRKYCRFSGVKFAKKHTQDKWKEIWYEGNFRKETAKICPKLELKKIRRSWWKHIYAFVYTYAKDSEIVPKV